MTNKNKTDLQRRIKALGLTQRELGLVLGLQDSGTSHAVACKLQPVIAAVALMEAIPERDDMGLLLRRRVVDQIIDDKIRSRAHLS